MGEKAPNGEKFQTDEAYPEIPTDDPEAALRFCRLLSRLVETAALSPATGDAASPSTEHAAPAAQIALSVVIPVYNEEYTIADMVAGVQQSCNFDLLVIDLYLVKVSPAAGAQSGLLHLAILRRNDADAEGDICPFLLDVTTR